MIDLNKIKDMIDSSPIMQDFADIESSKLPEYQIDSKIPEGPIAEKWTNYKAHQKLVNPANKRHLDIIVVGTGLAGASAASTLGELGFNVLNFCIQDSPRRAHSIAAQGGINAAKNYQNDGDSVYRLFYDTVKGGDFRSREANVYRLAEVSNNIIDQCVEQGVPFAREYGGLLANRSFGGAQVSRTFYAKGQTGQQGDDVVQHRAFGALCQREGQRDEDDQTGVKEHRHGYDQTRDAQCPRGLFVTELPHHGHSQRLCAAGFFQNGTEHGAQTYQKGDALQGVADALVHRAG